MTYIVAELCLIRRQLTNEILGNACNLLEYFGIQESFLRCIHIGEQSVSLFNFLSKLVHINLETKICLIINSFIENTTRNEISIHLFEFHFFIFGGFGEQFFVRTPQFTAKEFKKVSISGGK